MCHLLDNVQRNHDSSLIDQIYAAGEFIGERQHHTLWFEHAATVVDGQCGERAFEAGHPPIPVGGNLIVACTGADVGFRDMQSRHDGWSAISREGQPILFHSGSILKPRFKAVNARHGIDTEYFCVICPVAKKPSDSLGPLVVRGDASEVRGHRLVRKIFVVGGAEQGDSLLLVQLREHFAHDQLGVVPEQVLLYIEGNIVRNSIPVQRVGKPGHGGEGFRLDAPDLYLLALLGITSRIRHAKQSPSIHDRRGRHHIGIGHNRFNQILISWDAPNGVGDDHIAHQRLPGRADHVEKSGHDRNHDDHECYTQGHGSHREQRDHPGRQISTGEKWLVHRGPDLALIVATSPDSVSSAVSLWCRKQAAEPFMQFKWGSNINGVDIAGPPECLKFEKAFFPSGERRCRGGANGNTQWLSGVGIHAGGKVDGKHRRSGGIDEMDVVQKCSRHVAAEPCSEERIDDEVDVVQPIRRIANHQAHALRNCCIGKGVAVLPRWCSGGDPHFMSGVVQMPRHGPSVAAVVARAAQYGDVAVVIDHLHRDLRGTRGGVLHQDDAGNTV